MKKLLLLLAILLLSSQIVFARPNWEIWGGFGLGIRRYNTNELNDFLSKNRSGDEVEQTKFEFPVIFKGFFPQLRKLMLGVSFEFTPRASRVDEANPSTVLVGDIGTNTFSIPFSLNYLYRRTKGSFGFLGGGYGWQRVRIFADSRKRRGNFLEPSEVIVAPEFEVKKNQWFPFFTTGYYWGAKEKGSFSLAAGMEFTYRFGDKLSVDARDFGVNTNEVVTVNLNGFSLQFVLLVGPPAD